MKRVVTPVFVTSWPNLFKATSYEGSEPRYDVVMIWDKKELEKGEAKNAFAALNKMVDDFIDVQFKGKKVPSGLKYPFKDGSLKVDENGDPIAGYGPGKIFAKATTKFKPRVVDQNLADILDSSEIYPGCLCRASVNVFYYNRKGNQGVGFGLQNVQKVADGDTLGGAGSDPRDDFSVIEDEVPI